VLRVLPMGAGQRFVRCRVIRFASYIQHIHCGTHLPNTCHTRAHKFALNLSRSIPAC
jgi:hypothetical protein